MRNCGCVRSGSPRCQTDVANADSHSGATRLVLQATDGQFAIVSGRDAVTAAMAQGTALMPASLVQSWGPADRYSTLSCLSARTKARVWRSMSLMSMCEVSGVSILSGG